MKRIASTCVVLFGLAAIPAAGAAATGCSVADPDEGESAGSIESPQAAAGVSTIALAAGGSALLVTEATIFAATAPAAELAMAGAMVASVAAPVVVLGVVAVVGVGVLVFISHSAQVHEGLLTAQATELMAKVTRGEIAGIAIGQLPGDLVNLIVRPTAAPTAIAAQTVAYDTARCNQLNSRYHGADACGGAQGCNGLTGTNRCSEIQARYDRSKRCYELRSEYNQHCLAGAATNIIGNHIRQAAAALANMRTCAARANAQGYTCPTFVPVAVPAPTPPPASCENSVGLWGCATNGQVTYQCVNRAGNPSFPAPLGQVSQWRICGAGCTCGAPPPAGTPTPPSP